MGNLKEYLGQLRTFVGLSLSGKVLYLRDAIAIRASDPGIESAVYFALGWLCRAQDSSLSREGGVARHFSIRNGWSSSYPETTGYIIPTMIECARLRNDPLLLERARTMLDWLVSIQMECGGFQGGLIDSKLVTPVTFNTGQILLGLAAGVKEFGNKYQPAMVKAADWLVRTQDADGCWRKHGTPFAAPGEKAYETHVAWGLIEAGRQEKHSEYAAAAMASISWALKQQKPNGWFDKCCLVDPTQPLTHTIGYVLRGVLEGYFYSKETVLLEAARRTGDGLLGVIDKEGFLPGRIDSSWRGRVRWACLTGTVQIAHCWLLLYQATGDTRYRDAAYRANSFVRKTMVLKGDQDIVGGIRGSFPIYGGYGTNEFLNWAAKFFVDSQILESKVRRQETDHVRKGQISA